MVACLLDETRTTEKKGKPRQDGRQSKGNEISNDG
jgi:hypothetical protein